VSAPDWNALCAEEPEVYLPGPQPEQPDDTDWRAIEADDEWTEAAYHSDRSIAPEGAEELLALMLSAHALPVPPVMADPWLLHALDDAPQAHTAEERGVLL
jgi:hypothetical protein